MGAHGRQAIAEIIIDLEQVERLAMQGMSYTQIAAALEISHDTLTRRREQQQGVQEAIERGQAKGIAVATNTLLKACSGEKVPSTSIRAIIYYMNNRANWKSNPDMLAAETSNYFIIGQAPSESAEEWVSQHKPVSALNSPKED